uniref:Uncharacterized protein n=1 Tax=Myotis myotis TaxID=51298 RepID=A0A7J7SBX9_MYOMY|nr:hypothetical protein mMyoMyo1_009462 [Myotis myotis]
MSSICPFLPSWSHVGQILSSPTLSLPALLLGLWPPISLTHPHLAVRGIFVKHKSNHVLLLQCIPCFSSVLRIGSYLLLVLKAWCDLPLTITISACLPDCLSSRPTELLCFFEHDQCAHLDLYIDLHPAPTIFSPLVLPHHCLPTHVILKLPRHHHL